MLFETRELVEPIKLVTSQQQLFKVQKYRKQQYKYLFPNVKTFLYDPFDRHAYVFFTKHDGKLTSTGRLVLDSAAGLPEDGVFPSGIDCFRKQGKRLAEFGRFVISKGNKTSLIKAYYSSLYRIAVENKIDIETFA